MHTRRQRAKLPVSSDSLSSSGSEDLVAKSKSLTDQAKEHDIDPTMFMLQQILQSHSVSNHDSNESSNPEKLSKIIGKLNDHDDVFVFLHRFEFELTNRHIPMNNFYSYMPACLTGHYREAYYMRVVLLNMGGWLLYL